ncbi:MAG TPA: hypothetical protein VEL76_23935 [Gemmataceae bacterium]|nr:hypothetical protein [Gemmataceae bacterium]
MTKRKALTEAEWLASQSMNVLMKYLRQHRLISREPGSRRRFRLFACACCRRVWHLFTDEHCRRAVEIAERAADGQVSRKELTEVHEAGQIASEKARGQANEGLRLGPGKPGAPAIHIASRVTTAAEFLARPGGGGQAAAIVASSVATAMGHLVLESGVEAFHAQWQSEECAQVLLLRDVFGNPFRPVSLDPDWLSSRGRTAATVAQGIYEQRRFEDLPILADALEEAGCPSAEIVAHCRSAGPHIRGCWALDLLLGKL